jgi:hypothetical protein
MPRKLQFALTILALATSIAVSLAATVKVLWLGVPVASPETSPAAPPAGARSDPQFRADLNSLRATLTTEDVAAWPQERQRQFLVQLERHISGGKEPLPEFGAMEPPQRERLQENSVQLARVWLLWKAEQYLALEEKQRPAFLDSLLEPANRRAALVDGPKPSMGAFLPPWLDRQQLAAHVDRVRAELKPAELFRIGAFLSALRERAQRKSDKVTR